jgi:hypothetical protein
LFSLPADIAESLDLMLDYGPLLLGVAGAVLLATAHPTIAGRVGLPRLVVRAPFVLPISLRLGGRPVMKAQFVRIPVHNAAVFTSPAAVARNVLADMTIYSQAGGVIVPRYRARWAHVPEFATTGDTAVIPDRVDIPAKFTMELDAALKYPDDSATYGYNTDSTAIARVNWKDPSKIVRERTSYLKVELYGANIPARQHWYVLQHGGVGSDLAILETKRPKAIR